MRATAPRDGAWRNGAGRIRTVVSLPCQASPRPMILLLSGYGQPRQNDTGTAVTSTPFVTLVHACIRLYLPPGYLVVTCYMPPRSSDLRSPNFHVGTGQRVVPCPMALPMLSP